MRFVPGRQVELARLESACHAARAGAGNLVLLTGEAGIGKSLLAQAVAAEAESLGMAVARGWCMDDPGAPILWPWRRVSRDLPDLGRALDVTKDLDSDDTARFQIVDAVASVLAAAAGDVGLVVILEDLHWADSLSLSLLRGLLHEITSLRVLFVGTSRHDGLGESALGRALPELLRGSNTLHIPLAGLTVQAVTTWLEGDPDTRGWAPHADDLVRRTGGNPFYIRSLTTELVASPGDDLTASFAERPTWRAVLVAPYRGLPEPARTTVATAAVLGERLSPTVLAMALDRPVQEVSDDLAFAVTAGILHFGDTGLAFNHSLVRDAIVADLGVAERAQAHAGVAAALERTGDPVMAGRAAIHWSRVEGAEAAARCRDLAERAAESQSLAPDRALELARLALESAQALGAPDEELAERLLVVARFEWAAGLLPQALRSCTSGLELAEAAGRPDLAADFALIPQGVGSFDVNQLVGAMCRRALAALPGSEVTRRARLLALSAVSAAEAAQSGIPLRGEDGGGQAERAPASLSAEALAVATASGDRRAELETIAAHHFVLSYPQSIAERTVLAARAVDLGASASTTMGELWGHLWQADLAFQLGDVGGVQQAIAHIEHVANRRTSPVARWHVLRLRAALAVLGGRFDEGRELARETRLVADRIGDLSMVGMHHAFHVQLGLVRGDPADFLPGALEMVQSAPVPLVRATAVLIFAARGELDRARSEFATLRDVPARMPLGPRWFGTVGQIGFGAVLVGDPLVARECYELLLPCARWCAGDGGGSPFAAGSNEHRLGLLAQAFGELGLAAEHLTRGVAVDDRIGARPYAALGRLALAECLEGGDPGRALGLAQAAADEFDVLDMPGPLAKAIRLRDRLDGRRALQTGGLTERELEVARLVGDLLTNQQIADQLFLSVRTVESHVRSALTKLGLTRRSEIARWIHDQHA